MKINTKQELKNLRGEPLVEGNGSQVVNTVGNSIANILGFSRTKGAMKLYALAVKFSTQDEVDLDDADLSLVKKEIGDTEIYMSVVSGQLLSILENLKDNNNDKTK